MVVLALFCLLFFSLSDALKSLIQCPKLSALSYPGIRASPGRPELEHIKERQLCAKTERTQIWSQTNSIRKSPSVAAQLCSPGSKSVSLSNYIGHSFLICKVATTDLLCKGDAVS